MRVGAQVGNQIPTDEVIHIDRHEVAATPLCDERRHGVQFAGLIDMGLTQASCRTDLERHELEPRVIREFDLRRAVKRNHHVEIAVGLVENRA